MIVTNSVLRAILVPMLHGPGGRHVARTHSDARRDIAHVNADFACDVAEMPMHTGPPLERPIGNRGANLAQYLDGVLRHATTPRRARYSHTLCITMARILIPGRGN